MKKIAILGATGHIAKNIIVRGLINPEQEWFHYSRQPQKVAQFIKNEVARPHQFHNLEYSEFDQHNYDAIINTVGITDQLLLKDHPQAIFEADEIDSKVLLYLQSGHEKARYIHFSSGALYGDVFGQPEFDGFSRIPVSPIVKENYYGISKLYLEARHRAQSQLLISDIRIFNYISPYLDLSSKYLITELINATREGKCFETSSIEIYRDFLHPDDLWNIINYLITSCDSWPVVEPASLANISKSDILAIFTNHFGLKVNIINGDTTSATGSKTHYYPKNPCSPIIATYSSYDTVLSIASRLCRGMM